MTDINNKINKKFLEYPKIFNFTNSSSTVVKCSTIEGRIYDKFNNESEIEIIFVKIKFIAKLSR